MKSTRLEAFTDGVMAVIITIMVLDLKIPLDPSGRSLLTLVPIFFSYALSFVLVGIYWINHHQLLHFVGEVDSRTLWSNMHLLFWLSLIPFATGYMGENGAAPLPVALYAGLLVLCAVAWWFLAHHATRHLAKHDDGLVLRQRRTRQVQLAVLINVLAIGMAFVYVPLALVLLVVPPAMYFWPERVSAPST